MATTAMATARRTDGSHRVRTPKPNRMPMPATSRGHNPSRRSSGAATAKTKATFWPDTANRWLRPAARKSSTSSGDCSRSSPSTRPVNRARRSVPSDEAPRPRVRRSSLANRLTGPPGWGWSSRSMLRRLPMWRRARWVRLGPVTGPRRPLSVTRSPASRSASIDRCDPQAKACTRRPPRRTSARTPPGTSRGSLTRVARAVTVPWRGAARTPSQARAPSDEARAIPARHTTAGRRPATRATTTPPKAASSGTGRASQAPAMTASASTTTWRSLTGPPAPSPAARPAWPGRSPSPRGAGRPSGRARAPGGRRRWPRPWPGRCPAGQRVARRWPR